MTAWDNFGGGPSPQGIAYRQIKAKEFYQIRLCVFHEGLIFNWLSLIGEDDEFIFLNVIYQVSIF